METENLAKFKKIVASLPPEKRIQIRDKMKGMSNEERMAAIDRMVEISEQRKIEITARPKVLAGSGRVPYAPSTDYEVKTPGTWTEKRVPNDTKIEIVKNPANKRPVKKTADTKAVRPQQKPIKKSEPSVARAGRDMVARQIEQKEIAAIEAELKKAKTMATVKKAAKITFTVLGRTLATVVCTLAIALAGFYVFLQIIMRGPSAHLRDQFVPSVMESSAGGVLAKWILSDEEIEAIMNSNTTKEFDEITDITLVNEWQLIRIIRVPMQQVRL